MDFPVIACGQFCNLYIPLIGFWELEESLHGNHENYINQISFLVAIFAQEYSISIFGFHAADVSISRDSTSSEFQTNNRGIFDLIWPTSNNYKTVFDEDNYSIKAWEKTIKQGSNKVRVSGSVTSEGYMKYKDESGIKIDNETQTVFTILEMVIMMDRKYLDTNGSHMNTKGAWEGRDLYGQTL